MAKGDDQTETVSKEPTVNGKVHQATADQCSAYSCDSAPKMHGSMECNNEKVSQGNAFAADDLRSTSDFRECPSEESYPSDLKTKLGTIFHSVIVIKSSKVKSNNNTRPKSGKEERKRHGYRRGIAFSVWSNNKSSRDSGNMVVVGWRGKNHKDKSSAAKQRRDKRLIHAELLGPRTGHFFQDIGAKHQTHELLPVLLKWESFLWLYVLVDKICSRVQLCTDSEKNLDFSNRKTRFQLTSDFSSRPWFSSKDIHIQKKVTKGLIMIKSICAEIYTCLTLKTGWKSESMASKEGVNRESLPKIDPYIDLPQIYILQTAQTYGIAIFIGIDPSSCQCNGSKNLKLSKVVLLVLGHFSFDTINRNGYFPPPSSQNAAEGECRGKESSDGAPIEFTIECPAEVLNQQLPPHALQDVNTRIGTFRKLSTSLLPTENLARHGFFCNDNNKIQCHSCLQFSAVEDIVRNPGSSIWHYPHCPYISRLRPVASDPPGRISDDVRDPPGQQSIYIPPGDVRQESYRISTFENFPVPSTSSRRSLAQAGFFFTGFFDRVKCFACGRTVQEWVATDNPADRKWHKDDCPFMRGENCGNVAIATHFNQLYGNLSTRPTQGNPGEEVIQQRDPVTGSIIRTVRYPADLPERIRQTGGTFEIGPNNQVTIRSGPRTGGRSHGPGLQEAPARLPATPLQQAQHQPMRHWRMANVISADHKRFLTNLYLNRELDRVASFARWPTGRPNVAPAALARTGFFYLGDMDRTQCFSCGGVLRNWTAEDDAASEHRAHFPNCRLLLGTETRNVPVPDLPVATDVRQRDFPCRFPSNPHMRSEAARVETFDQRWPRNRTAATPAEIAQAGFFYLGERDRVKCWYCNGGLQHWEYDDVPWIEHAKWFPNCQFLLSVKGQHFVYRHLAMCPQLPRPIIARQDGSPLDPRSERQPSQPPEDIPPSASRVRQPSPPPTIIDPQEEMRKKQERIDSVLKNSDLVKNVLAMGFSEQIVRQLLVEKVDSGTEESPDDIYGTTLGLLDDVMKREEELKQEEEQRSNIAAAVPSMPGPSTSYMPSIPSVYMPTPQSSLGPAPGSGKYNVSYFGDEDEEGDRDMYGIEPMAVETSMNSETPAKQIEGGEDPTSLQEALNKIEEERMCKVCFSNPADMVFVPCGHMCCCMECTKALRQCPVCRVKIQKAIKTYLS